LAITVDWVNKVVFIPEADLTPNGVDPISGRALYTLDTEAFRREVKALEASPSGLTYPDIIAHNTEVSVSGVTIARVIVIVNGYSVEFEDGTYAVTLTGSNNNIADVAVVNQVSIRPTNTAGLVSAGGAAAITEQDKDDIATKVWNYTQ
jgi:hypothetical protein